MNNIESVGAFIAHILEIKSTSGMAITYRGHKNKDYKLIPSIFRDELRYQNEHIILRELIASHPEEFRSDTTALETLARMQHYSLPTRLLDVSQNPLVALYFACEEAEVIEKRRDPKSGKLMRKRILKDGEVIVFATVSARVRYFDSDRVSCVANLARLGYALKQKIDTNLDRENFNKDLSIRRLVHFIRQEKSGFEADILPAHLNSINLVKPKQNNKRILAQAGAFFLFGLDRNITDAKKHRIAIIRIPIESKAKVEILKDLDKLGINERTLFPDIERAARYITNGLVSPTVAVTGISASTSISTLS